MDAACVHMYVDELGWMLYMIALPYFVRLFSQQYNFYES